MIALTRRPSAEIDAGERSFVPGEQLNLDAVQKQHLAYEAALARAGLDVQSQDPLPDFPDSTFIEDTAVILDELAVLASMGAASRSREPSHTANLLKPHRELVQLETPATLEGGDVLVVGRTLLVGLSRRTNREGIESLQDIVRPYGYQVQAVPVHGCLHLKTALGRLPDDRLLVNPNWIDVIQLTAWECLPVPAAEPWGANLVTVRDHLVMAAEHHLTRELIREQGFQPSVTPLAEFAKAEGGATCLSLIFSP